MAGLRKGAQLVRKPADQDQSSAQTTSNSEKKTMLSFASRLVSIIEPDEETDREEVAQLIYSLAQKEQQQEKPSTLAWAARTIAAKAVKAALKLVARTLIKRAVVIAGRMFLRTLTYLGRMIFRWAIRPILLGVANILIANPITAIGLAVVGGGYLIWREFFSEKGKAKRAAEEATMVPGEEQPSITQEGAAGTATPVMKEQARASRAYREEIAPKPTADQAKLLGLPEPTPSAAKPVSLEGHLIGATSAKYESAKGLGGVGTVSTGKGDKGGISYGSYQFASNEGTVDAYLRVSKYKDEFKGLRVNSPAFIDKWKEIARRDPEGFFKDQHDYVQSKYYDLAMAQLRKAGIDFRGRGPAIHDMVWSTAVQHGPGVPPIKAALARVDVSKLSDAEIVTLVQDYKKANVESLFKSSPKLWPGLRNRAANEKQDLLALNQAWIAKNSNKDTKSQTETQVAVNKIPATDRVQPAQAPQQSTIDSQSGHKPVHTKTQDLAKVNGRLIGLSPA